MGESVEMGQLEKKATRDGFGEGLLELGKTRPEVVVLSGDLADSTRAQWFQKEYPNRFFELGIAEQDMMGAAAGLALSGKIPFACSFGVFATGRAWEQIRTSVCNMNLNVKIGGTHCGISVGEDGTTNEALEDISAMRCQVNMTVIVPCDAIEAKKATLASANLKGPVYLRLGRNPAPMVTRPEDPFTIGKANLLRDGKDVSLLACGLMVHEALQAADLLAQEKIQARVINMHTVKPIDRDIIRSACRETGAIVTAEEHTVVGGFGSAVAEVVVEEHPVPMARVGILDRIGESGKPDELFEVFHLTAKDIVQAAHRVIQKKRK